MDTETNLETLSGGPITSYTNSWVVISIPVWSEQSSSHKTGDFSLHFVVAETANRGHCYCDESSHHRALKIFFLQCTI